jgi:hypothetical protein
MTETRSLNFPDKCFIKKSVLNGSTIIDVYEYIIEPEKSVPLCLNNILNDISLFIMSMFAY